MLKLKDIYYDEFIPEKEPKEIETIKKKFRVNGDEDYLDNECLEFLYMRDSTFTWGRVGYTNGAFILKEMREYFRTLF